MISSLVGSIWNSWAPTKGIPSAGGGPVLGRSRESSLLPPSVGAGIAESSSVKKASNSDCKKGKQEMSIQ